VDEELKPLQVLAEKLLIGHYARHVFLCTGESCSAPGVGEAAWEVLKRELKERNLSLAAGPDACYRTKVGCLRVCTGGPILLVYPEGTYYGGMSAERIPEFVQKHLVDREPIESRIFARNPLPVV
jgi:(2Fe-2S) ferredoxin